MVYMYFRTEAQYHRDLMYALQLIAMVLLLLIYRTPSTVMQLGINALRKMLLVPLQLVPDSTLKHQKELPLNQDA